MVPLLYVHAGSGSFVPQATASCQFVPADIASTYALVAKSVELVPAFEATTEATVKTPLDDILPTLAPEESFNCIKGAVALAAALITKDSS